MQRIHKFGGLSNKIKTTRFSPDGTKIAVAEDGMTTITIFDMDYALVFPGWADWDDGALPYAQDFLSLHPHYTEDDFQNLVTEPQHRGNGWLRPEGVRVKLIQMQQSIETLLNEANDSKNSIDSGKKGLFNLFGKKR